MSIVELVALFLILIVAIVCQAMKDEVNPIVWLVGGIVGFAVKFVDAGMCSWKEGLITLAIMVVVMIVAILIQVLSPIQAVSNAIKDFLSSPFISTSLTVELAIC